MHSDLFVLSRVHPNLPQSAVQLQARTLIIHFVHAKCAWFVSSVYYILRTRIITCTLCKAISDRPLSAIISMSTRCVLYGCAGDYIHILCFLNFQRCATHGDRLDRKKRTRMKQTSIVAGCERTAYFRSAVRIAKTRRRCAYVLRVRVGR
jgi:hypothetical protein